MSFRRLTKILTSATALLLLLSVVGPSMQHVCAQLGMDVVCPVMGHGPTDASSSDAAPPCHDEEDASEPAGDRTAMACCDASLAQLVAPDALVSDRTVDALHGAMATALLLPPMEAVSAEERLSSTIQDRAPPAPDVPLFLLHASFLN
ncbi:MAG: hypothetical protein GVY12_17625 [Bacteroidetes bacterium]|jgi:hypothetical protein|nr:hypothetical protein [Bacteroidota bacterium]